MIKTEIEYEEVAIDIEAFDPAYFVETAERALYDVMGFHDKQYAKGRDPNGKLFRNKKGQRLTEAYKKYKKSLGRKGIPNLSLEGDLLQRRDVYEVDDDEVTLEIDIEDEDKAEGLVEMGYDFHFFSKKNIKHVEKLFRKKASELLGKAVKVTQVKKST